VLVFRSGVLCGGDQGCLGCSWGLSYYTTGDWRKLLRTSEVFSKNGVRVSLERELVQLVADPLSPTALQCPSGAAGRHTNGFSAIECTNIRRYNRMV